MKLARAYTLPEFLHWTRRKLYLLVALALLPVLLYHLLGWHWVALPWQVAALLGTAASFIVGFKNAQTYSRTQEAQQVWASLMASSRYWGLICRDFPLDGQATRALVYRHLAWLTVLRHGLREPRIWETVQDGSNAEYRKTHYLVPEHASTLQADLQPLLTAQELQALQAAPHKGLGLLDAQSRAIRSLYASQHLAVLHHTEMQKTLGALLDQQARVERIKNFPYPRQYATINAIFVWSFAALLPFCFLHEFARLDALASGLLAGHMVLLSVPFSVLIAWLYVSLDQVGESTENPFEGSANDVPISQISRQLEIELRSLLGESDLPAPLLPRHQIAL